MTLMYVILIRSHDNDKLTGDKVALLSVTVFFFILGAASVSSTHPLWKNGRQC
jgi:hypothetical protein